jgi:hypothetical protein
MVQIGGRFMFLLPHFLNAEKCSPENARQYLRVFSPPLTFILFVFGLTG